ELLVAGNHRLVRAALVGLKRRGGGLGKSATPDGLGDDAFAAHPGDLVLAVALEQLGFHLRVRSLEPGVAEPAHAYGEPAAVERHGGDDARSLDAARRVCRGL